MQEHVIAELAEFAHDCVRVREEIRADPGSAIDRDVREQDGVVSDFDILIDDDVRTEMRIAADLCRGMDNRRRVNGGR